MASIISKLIGDKKQWNAMEARAAALPLDYRAVYGKIKPYMWKLTTGDGSATIATLESVLAQFEQGSARHVAVLEVTGADVAAFCDTQLSRHGATTYVDAWRTTLNADVTRELAE